MANILTAIKSIVNFTNLDIENITYLSVRGMWIIENPAKVFESIYQHNQKANFQMVILMKKSKFDSFSSESKNILKGVNNLEKKDIKIKNPNNPANLIEAVLITYKVL